MARVQHVYADEHCRVVGTDCKRDDRWLRKGVRIVEIKINKEVREYSEKVLFGLTARQFILGLAAVAVALVLFIHRLSQNI